ncbi:hypothetical protein TNCV_4690421 [Trichonephila clavipes]|nr:hypothetical protein TNCV_4690421 [Trichonephila clavipes]
MNRIFVSYVLSLRAVDLDAISIDGNPRLHTSHLVNGFLESEGICKMDFTTRSFSSKEHISDDFERKNIAHFLESENNDIGRFELISTQ